MKHNIILLLTLFMVTIFSCNSNKQVQVEEYELDWHGLDDTDTSAGYNFWSDFRMDTLNMDSVRYNPEEDVRILHSEPFNPSFGVDKSLTLEDYIGSALVVHDYESWCPYGGVNINNINPDTLSQTHVRIIRTLIKYVCEPSGNMCESRGWMAFKTNYYRSDNGPDITSSEPMELFLETGYHISENAVVIRTTLFKWE